MKDNKEVNKENIVENKNKEIKAADKKKIESKEIKKSSYTKKKESQRKIYPQALHMLNPLLITLLLRLQIFMEM